MPKIPVSIEIHHIAQSPEGSPKSTRIGFTVQPTPESPSRHLIGFTPRKSGEYRIQIRIEGEDIPGSPMQKIFSPGPPDPSQSTFSRATPPLVFVTGHQYKLFLDMKDSYGNRCRGNDIDTERMQLTVTHVRKLAYRTSGTQSISVRFG